MQNIYNILMSVLPVLLSGVIGPILILFIQHKLNNSKKPNIDPIKDAAVNGEIVCEVLETIMSEIECDRVWIHQFHNGGHFYPTGKSIQKFSMVYEIVSINATSLRQTFQNIPINLFSKFINRLLDHEEIIIPDFKNPEISTYGLKYLADETNTKSSYIFALKGVSGKMIGILGIDYTKRKKDLNQEQIIDLRIESAKVATLLDSFLNKK